MRLVRFVLCIAGAIELALAIGFFFQVPWAIDLWPVPDTRLSYVFIAAILAGGAAPLIWIGLAGELGALASYGLSFGVMYAGMGLAALRFSMLEQWAALARFGVVMCALAGLCLVIFLLARRYRMADQPTP